MRDEKLKELYANAHNLIIENNPDNSHKLAEYIKSWLRKKKEDGLLVCPENNGDNWFKFKTSFMTEILPDKSDREKEWESGFEKYTFYELDIIKGQRLELNLIFNTESIPEECRENSAVFIESSGKKDMTIERKRPFLPVSKLSGFSEDLSEEATHDMLDQILADVEKYEQRVKERLNQHI